MAIPELEEVRLFKELDTPSFNDVSEFCTKLYLADGEILISENETENFDLYVLCKGKVEIISNASGVTSSEITLTKQQRDIFGEISWLTGKKRTATIRAHGPVEAIHVDGNQLSDYLQSNPQAGFAVMRATAYLLAESMNQTNQLLKQILWNAII
jgi:CRP-like cAMP-binding protein